MMGSCAFLNRCVRPALLLGAGALLSSLMACGSADEGPQSRLNIEVYGWGPSVEGETFVLGMPAYNAAHSIRLKVTQPRDGRILLSESFLVADHRGKLPNVTYGENLRVDLEVLDTTLNVVASGSTPIFTFDESTARRSFRIMVAPTNQASPVGSLVADRETGQNKLVQSRFDYSGLAYEGTRNWLGRVGHAIATTEDGQILIVGGGDASSRLEPAKVPSFYHVFSDIQLFDPVTGYFTDLSYDDAARAVQSTGLDRLRTPRAFHTVTALGNDRFLVAGGYTLRETEMRALNTVEIIDLRAPVGMRVQELSSQAFLSQPRAFHTATYRPADGAVVIAGGLSHGGAEDVLDSVDVIHVRSGMVESKKMAQARVDHAAVLSPDGETVWVLGGRNKEGVLASTEMLAVEEATGETASAAGPRLLSPRFGAVAVPLTASNGNLVAMIGGFSSTTGQAIANYEVGGFYREDFVTDPSWILRKARGGLQAIELPQTGDIMLLGGMADGQVVSTAERLRYRGLEDPLPLSGETQGAFYQVRHGFGAALTSNGFIFLVGGVAAQENISLDNAEYFNALDPVRNRTR